MSDPSNDGSSRYLRTELLDRIAHELRGPAGVTLGALDELEHALGPELVEQHRLLLAMARRGARRVLRTAERLTRTAQLESGLPFVSCTLTDVRGLVRDAVREAELVEGRASVKLSLALPEDPCVADIDGNWWSVALAELIAQAVRCARKSVEVQVELRDELVVVRVVDDRVAVVDAPSVRFVPLQDRRDAALGWPLICDVARAHKAVLSSTVRQDDAGAAAGLCVELELRRAG